MKLGVLNDGACGANAMPQRERRRIGGGGTGHIPSARRRMKRGGAGGRPDGAMVDARDPKRRTSRDGGAIAGASHRATSRSTGAVGSSPRDRGHTQARRPGSRITPTRRRHRPTATPWTTRRRMTTRGGGTAMTRGDGMECGPAAGRMRATNGEGAGGTRCSWTLRRGAAGGRSLLGIDDTPLWALSLFRIFLVLSEASELDLFCFERR